MITAAEKKIQYILQNSYSTENYVLFVQELFDNVKLVAPNKFNKECTNFSYHIEGSSHVGYYTAPDNKKLIIASVKLKRDAYVKNSRSTQRSYAKVLIENGNCDAALIAFYTEGEPRWRLSFVRLDYEMKVDNGKVKMVENMTPAKRYSFLVGKDEPCHTAVERFRHFVADENYHPTLDELEEAFSVEAVTKEFFNLYCEKFKQLLGYLEDNPDFVEEAKYHNFTAAQFAKKLLGQIVFLYFLQKKGWLGVNTWPDVMNEKAYKKAFFKEGKKSRDLLPLLYTKVGDGTYRRNAAGFKTLNKDDETSLANCVIGKPWGSGPKDFMRRLFNVAVAQKANFFDDYLEPLFYNALNVNRGEQSYAPDLHCRIPFLSGGLFEPIDGYDWKNNNFAIPNEVFSNREGDNHRTGDGILDIFDRYNFTMSEDEPLEREVAVDPEMLGKVFENLLEVKDRKAKGAFYTPREIVHYMCQESLINYLQAKVQVNEQAIRDFILYGDFMKDEDTIKEKRQGKGEMLISSELFKVDNGGKIVVNKLLEIDKALQEIRVADPAVGSGAFPLGMLNEIVRARQNISAYLRIGMTANQARIMYSLERSPYTLKHETIRNCIFAADIEPSAVDIARLRLWLALVIDDNVNPNAHDELDGHINPLPLPNLECNIVCGNSLLDEFEGVPLINKSELIGTATKGETNFGMSVFEPVLKKLIATQDELFKCDDTRKKQSLLETITSLKDELILNQFTENGVSPEVIEKYHQSKELASKPYVLWQIDFARVFREKGGFDVVIGNPPYIGFHKVPHKEINKKLYMTASGKYDFYVLFIEKGIYLLKDDGFLSYICPSYFSKREYGKNTRKLLLENTSIEYFVDFKDAQQFDKAQTYTCLIGLRKAKVIDSHIIKVIDKSSEKPKTYDINQFELSLSAWNLEKQEDNTIVNKLSEKSVYTLNDIVTGISEGIVTGANDVYLISQNIVEERMLEGLYLKKAYKGKDLKNGGLLDSQQMLFYPYTIDGKGKTKVIDEHELCIKCPNLYQYLLEFKEQLGKRGYFAKSSKKWFELWNCRSIQHFYNKKFVFSEISLRNDFILVGECFYTDSACGMELKEDFKKYESYLYRYLNSKLITYVYKKMSVPKANGYSIYKKAFLKNLPVVFPFDITTDIFDNMGTSEFEEYLFNCLGLTDEERKAVISYYDSL